MYRKSLIVFPSRLYTSPVFSGRIFGLIFEFSARLKKQEKALSNITTRAGRGKLEDRKEPHWMKLRAGCFLGFATGPQSWHARYRDRTGKQNWKPLGDGMDYNEAKAEAERWFDLATSGNRKAPSRGTVRSALASYVLNLRSNGRRPTAVEVAGRFHITVPRDKEFGHMKLEDVGRDDVETWRNGLRKGRQPRSVNRQVRAVIAALNFAVSERGFVGKREAWELKHFQDDGEQPTPLFLTPAHRDPLAAAPPPALAALLTGYTHTGCRPSELEKAVVADFDEAGCTLLLRHRKGKGSKLKARAVELDDDGVKFFAEQVRGKVPKAPLAS